MLVSLLRQPARSVLKGPKPKDAYRRSFPRFPTAKPLMSGFLKVFQRMPGRFLSGAAYATVRNPTILLFLACVDERSDDVECCDDTHYVTTLIENR
jgi:hypothetical protein